MLENMGWIVAASVAVVGWVVLAMKFSHTHGALDQRVKTLESTAGDHREVRDTMIRLEGRIGSIEGILGELKDGMVWMTKTAPPMYGPPAPPGRPARAKA